MLSRRKPPCNLAKRRFQPNIQRIGLAAWALFVVWGATVGTLYLADAIFGFGLVFLVVTSVVCTASKNFKNTRMNPALLPVLESVDTEWDRVSAANDG